MPQVPKTKLPPLQLGEENIGSRLARYRKKRGLTQNELANKIGITRQGLSAYESGRVRLHDEMVIRFALALKVSTDKILGLDQMDGEEDPSTTLRLTKRLRQIERLPANDQRALVRNIDMFLKASEKDSAEGNTIEENK